MRKTILFTTLVLLTACGKNTDKIGEASTVFNLLGKNDRIEIEAFHDPDVRQVFKRNASFAFKSLQIVRYYDPKRKAFAYMVYSDKIIEGSPKNSLSAFSCYSTARVTPPSAASSPASNVQHIGACEISA